MDRGFSHGTVVIQVRNLVGQSVSARIGLGRQSLGLISAIAGIQRLLIGLAGLVIHAGDALLCAGIYIMNGRVVLGRSGIKFVGFFDDWLGLLADIVLCRAASSDHHG